MKKKTGVPFHHQWSSHEGLKKKAPKEEKTLN